MNKIKLLLKLAVIIFIVIVLSNIFQGAKSVFFASEFSSENFFSKVEVPTNIAHRGASGNYPENTLLAFERAVEQGVDALELDVWLTADEQVVVIHDETVDRTTDGEGKVRDYTLDELRNLDAGYNFQPVSQSAKSEKYDEDFPFRGEGIYIPTLKEVFTEFPDTPVIIDIKKYGEHMAKQVSDVIEKTGSEERVVLASMDSDTVKKLRQLHPEASTVAGESEVFKFYILSHLGVAGWLDWNFDGLFVPTDYDNIPVLTIPFRTAAEASGTYLHVWTINDQDEMERLLNMGIHGILTDYPKRLNDKIRE